MIGHSQSGQVIRGHQFDGLSAEESYTVPLTALAKCLSKFGVIIDGREQTRATLRITSHAGFIFVLAEIRDSLESARRGLAISGCQPVAL